MPARPPAAHAAPPLAAWRAAIERHPWGAVLGAALVGGVCAIDRLASDRLDAWALGAVRAAVRRAVQDVVLVAVAGAVGEALERLHVRPPVGPPAAGRAQA